MAKRSPNGSITAPVKTITTKNGKKQVTWRSGFSWDGHRYDVKAKTQKEALEKAEKKRYEVRNGIGVYGVTAPDITVKEWLEEWQSVFWGNLVDNTKREYIRAIDLHINPAIGNIKLANLTLKDIQKMINNLSNHKNGESLSAKSALNIFGTINVALEDAVRIKYIRSNPAKGVQLPKRAKKPIRVFTDEELELFINAIQNHKYRNFYIVAIETGMRISEILGLTLDSIDLKNRKITVYQQLHKDIHDGTKCWLVPTKTKNVRVIYLDDLAYEAIQNELEIQKANSKKPLWYNNLNLLFTNENGHNLCITTVEKPFKRILKRLGIEGIRFHDIRHTYATTCLKNGDPVNVVAANLGHSNTSTTLNVYAHFTDEMLRESAERRNRQNEKLLKTLQQKQQKSSENDKSKKAKNSVVGKNVGKANSKNQAVSKSNE